MSEALLFDGARYISSRDAAASHGFTRDYVAKLCREGRVIAKRVGRSWYVSEKSLKDLVLKQSEARGVRNEHLSQKRAREYRRSTPVSPSVSIVSHVSSAVSDHVSSAVVRHNDAIAGVARGASSHAGLQEAALRAAHIPTYVVSPVGEMLHRIIALTSAIVIACSAYAFVDPAFRHFALVHVRESATYVQDVYRGLENTVLARSQTETGVRVQQTRGDQKSVAAVSSSQPSVTLTQSVVQNEVGERVPTSDLEEKNSAEAPEEEEQRAVDEVYQVRTESLN